jgi:dTMP kinase
MAKLTQKSFFIVLDGIDGSGTTTHSNLLKGFLETREFKVHLTQEPSNSEIGLLVRKYLKDKAIPPITDALLFAADRSLHYLGEIKQKLEQGYIVISDRYIESSIVYQSLQSDLVSIKWVKTINKFVAQPDLTIILDIDPKTALARKTQQELEKFEDTPFLDKVRALYLKRAKIQKYAVVNSDDIIEFVQDTIQQLVLQIIEE